MTLFFLSLYKSFFKVFIYLIIANIKDMDKVKKYSVTTRLPKIFTTILNNSIHDINNLYI